MTRNQLPTSRQKLELETELETSNALCNICKLTPMMF